MLLSRLARLGNFCSNLLSPFLSIVHILSSPVILFQILLYTLFSRFPWSTLPPFPSCLNFHILTYLKHWCLHVWHDHTTADDFEISYPQSSQQHPPSITKNISRRPINQHVACLTPHITLIIRRSIPRNLASSETVSFHVFQQYNKTGLTQHW